MHGIYAATPGCTVVNNITFNNAAKGIHVFATATRCVVANNTSFNNQDGFVFGNDGSDRSSFDNSIISNNIAFRNVRYGLYESGSVGTHNHYLNNLIDSNCLHEGACNDPRTQTFMITGVLIHTVTANPEFVDYTGFVNGNYRLTRTSPAINAGTSTGAPATDFDGGRRPQGGAWDIGAYEFGAAPAVWPWIPLQDPQPGNQGITLEFTDEIAPPRGTSPGGKITLLPSQSPAEEFALSRMRRLIYVLAEFLWRSNAERASS
jgi:parallel beta-helix repeat protein